MALRSIKPRLELGPGASLTFSHGTTSKRKSSRRCGVTRMRRPSSTASAGQTRKSWQRC